MHYFLTNIALDLELAEQASSKHQRIDRPPLSGPAAMLVHECLL